MNAHWVALPIAADIGRLENASSVNQGLAYYASKDWLITTLNDDVSGSDSMYRFRLDSSQNPILSSRVSISTPTRVQGLAVADGYYIFSTSYGRNCYSQLKFKSTSTGHYGRSVELPPLSEGIVNVPRGAAGYTDDWLYIVYESPSKQYSDGTMRQFNVNRTTLTTLTP